MDGDATTQSDYKETLTSKCDKKHEEVQIV